MVFRRDVRETWVLFLDVIYFSGLAYLWSSLRAEVKFKNVPSQQLFQIIRNNNF